MAKVVGFDTSVLRKVTHRDCGAMVEFSQNEVQSQRVSCMGDVDTEYYIFCPNCGQKIWVSHYQR